MLYIIYGCSHLSTNWDICSVTLSRLETIGRIPIGFLCIFLRKYSLDVLWFAGGLKNWYQFLGEIHRLELLGGTRFLCVWDKNLHTSIQNYTGSVAGGYSAVQPVGPVWAE